MLSCGWLDGDSQVTLMLITKRTQLSDKTAVVLVLMMCALVVLCISLAFGQSNIKTPTARCSDHQPRLRIMPLGDSITESRRGFSSYRLTLWRTLRAAGCKVNLVGSRRGVSVGLRDQPSVAPANPNFDQDHEGHWGYRTDQILAHLKRWLERSNPDVVLIHLGSNDIFQKQSIGSTINELESVVDTIQLYNPQAITIIARLIPSRREPQAIQQLNAHIAGLARKKDSPAHPVRAVNMQRDFSIVRDIQPDGVHPNNAGDRKMGVRFTSTLLTILNQDR